MLFIAPIEHRDTTVLHKCAHCGYIQNKPEGMSPETYFTSKHYLDFGLAENCEKYLNEKYVICEKCGNIATFLHQDNISYIGEDKYRNLLEIIDETERKLQMMHCVHNSMETLVDLYYFYQYRKNETKENAIRTQIIERCQHSMKTPYKVLLIEMYRRNSDFDIAMSLIKKMKNKDIMFFGISLNTILQQQKSLCKKQISNRVMFEAK